MRVTLSQIILYFLSCVFFASCVKHVPVQNPHHQSLFFEGTQSTKEYKNEIERYRDAFNIQIPKGWREEVRNKYNKKRKEAEILYLSNKKGKERGECTISVRHYPMPKNKLVRNKKILEKIRLQNISSPVDISLRKNFVSKGFVNGKNSVGVASSYIQKNMYGNNHHGAIVQFFIRNQERKALMRVFCSVDKQNAGESSKAVNYLLANIEVL